MRRGALIVCFLVGVACAAGGPRVSAAGSETRVAPAEAPRSQGPDGAALFALACATCHLEGGGLLGFPRTPDLFEDPLPRGETREALLHAMRVGVDPPRMPAFADGLRDDEREAIASYVVAQRQRLRSRDR